MKKLFFFHYESTLSCPENRAQEQPRSTDKQREQELRKFTLVIAFVAVIALIAQTQKITRSILDAVRV